MKRFSSRGAFWTVALILTVTLWSSAAATIVFPVYAAEWGLATSVTTAVFAAYPVLLIATLLIFGNVSDVIGRRNTLLAGLIFLLGGAVSFALAADTFWLFAGRALQGVGAGLTAGAGAAALVEFNPTKNLKAPGSLNTITQGVGLFIATILGAVLIRFAPDPLHLSYWPLTLMVLVSLALALFLPAHTRPAGTARKAWRPAGVRVPRHLAGIYAVAALSSAVGFGEGSLFLSLGALIARDVTGASDILVIGAVLSISYVLGVVGAYLAGKIDPTTSILLGSALTIVMAVLLAASAQSQSFTLFIAASLAGGSAYGLAGAGGIGLAAMNAPAHLRGQMLSAVLLVAYLFLGGTALGAGLASASVGLDGAIRILAPILIGLAAASLAATTALRIHLARASRTPKAHPAAPAVASGAEAGSTT